jgi:hypothetical protein
MQWITSAKKAATRAKINGEILLLDRDIVARKKAFGVELYDLIAGKESKEKNSILRTPALFKPVESEIKEPLESCRAEVEEKLSDKHTKENEILLLEVRMENAMPAYTASETITKAGKWVSNSGAEAKLQCEIMMLDREIKLRKEQFGLEVWDAVFENLSMTKMLARETKKGGIKAVTGTIGGIGKSVKSSISSNLGKLSKDEQAIEECLEKAKKDVMYIEGKKKQKEREIASLDW